MLSREDAKEDLPASVSPPIAPAMPWRVAEVAVLPSFCLNVRFIDGLSGVVDMSQRVSSQNAGVFAQLRDPATFSQAYVEYGAVTWPGEIDLAPDAMYNAIKAHGIWKLT